MNDTFQSEFRCEDTRLPEMVGIQVDKGWMKLILLKRIKLLKELDNTKSSGPD